MNEEYMARCAHCGKGIKKGENKRVDCTSTWRLHKEK